MIFSLSGLTHIYNSFASVNGGDGEPRVPARSNPLPTHKYPLRPNSRVGDPRDAREILIERFVDETAVESRVAMEEKGAVQKMKHLVHLRDRRHPPTQPVP